MNIELKDKNGITLKTAGKYCSEDVGIVPKLQSKSVTTNGSVVADEGYCGLGSVTVAVPATPTEEKTVDLAMASGNQTINPTSGKVLSQVVVKKPATLVAGNVKKGIDIGGVIGTLEPQKEEEAGTATITANGAQTFSPTSGKVFSKFTATVNVALPTLNAPTIAISDKTLTITNPASNGNFVTKFKVFSNGTALTEAVIKGSTTTVDLSTLLTEVGTYSITAKASAANFNDSAASSAVNYEVAAASGYNVTFAGWTVDVDYGAFVRIYDAQSATGNYTSLPSSGGTVNCTSGYLYLVGNYGDTGLNDSTIAAPTVTGGVTIESIDPDTGVSSGDSWILFKVTGDGTVGSFYISCFIEGTQITLADGITKAIEDITYDDELLVWNFYDGKFDTAKPTWIKVEETAPRYNLVKFSDGREFGTVGAGGEKGYHRVFNKEAGAFTHIGTNATPIGTTTFADDGTNPTIVSEEIIEKPVKYYNIITDKHYNIFANGILTSCRLSNKYHIKDMKYVGESIIHEQEEKEYRERLEKNRKWLG